MNFWSAEVSYFILVLEPKICDIITTSGPESDLIYGPYRIRNKKQSFVVSKQNKVSHIQGHDTARQLRARSEQTYSNLNWGLRKLNIFYGAEVDEIDVLDLNSIYFSFLNNPYD